MIDLDNMTKRFLMNEGQITPDIFSYIQTLGEILGNMRPASVRQGRSLSVAKEQLREIKRYARRMNERVSVLEEKLKVLEEEKQ